MVAEAEKPSTREKHPNAGKMINRIDLLTRAQARNLYVVRQLSAQEVATQTGLTAKQVYSLAEREGWSKTRAEIKRKSLAASDAREADSIDELVEAVAVKSSVLSLGTLDNAIEELKTPGEFQAKNLQALSVAAKNFVGLYRQAKQLDVNQGDASGAQINVMFVGALPRTQSQPAQAQAQAQSAPRNVTPDTHTQSGASVAAELPASGQTVDVSATPAT